MKNILNIIKLDYITVKSPIMFVILVPVIFTFIMPQFGVFMGLVVSSTLFKYVFQIGEKNGYDKLYGALPINKKELVAARFAEGLCVPLIVSFIFWGYGHIVISSDIYMKIARALNYDDLAKLFGEIDNMFSMGSIAAAAFFLCGLMNFLILVDFKWGTAKEAAGSMIISTAILIIIFVIQFGLKVDILDKLKKLSESGEYAMIIVLYVAGAAVTVIYAFITYALIKDKEL